MKQNWNLLKKIIYDHAQHGENFLSLIDDDGYISKANSSMVRFLHLKEVASSRINLFDIMHPVCHDGFRAAIQHSAGSNDVYPVELFLKNGYYHPMKWRVFQVPDDEEVTENYLCIGHKILDDERQKQFNQLGDGNYQLIMEGLNAGFLFQNCNGELIAANHQAADIFGMTLEKLYQLSGIKKYWNQSWIIRSECGKRLSFEESPFMVAARTGLPQKNTLAFKLRTGEERWLQVFSQPLFEENSSTPFAIASNITDITRERILSGQLEEKEAIFKAFMKQMPNLGWVVDEEANLVLASQSFYEYFKLDRNSTKDKKITELVPPGVAEALFQKHVQVLESGKPLETTEKISWVDGTNFIFHINIFPIEGIQGKRLLGGHAVNLADKFATEKRLREVNDRLLLLTRTTSDAIWEWDMQTGNIFRNDALMDLIGYQHDNPKGLSWWLRRIHPDDRNRVSDIVKESTDNHRLSWEDQYRFKCADGTYKHIRDKGYIVYENGLPVKMIGSLHDVSNVKEMEDLLLKEKLEKQKEISETVIRVQEKERSRIGHELHDNVNQILSTCKLFVDMLTPSSTQEKELKTKSLEYIMLAIEEIRKLSKELVVPQLLGNGLVGSIKGLLDDIQISTNIKIRFTHDNEIDLLSSGKKVTLFRIVQEQFKNILKYSQAKQVDIYLQSRDNKAVLMISDNGIGFDTKQASSGIGLSNIHERARFYNGEVSIESSKGNGCVLTVILPVLD